ncbi:MAG: sigma-54 dependent transcriptional regulator [bacterium]|nr:sigma-54 dependent transcriptional regulator [bacterium]MDT8366123.1 sigma-54 dependent transcriptional regulator [bacterium]
MEKFPGEIQLLENFDHLDSTLGSSVWNLLILDHTNCDFRVEELIRSLKMEHPTLPVIVICGDTAQDAIEVMRLGVADYLIKPVRKDRLFSSVQGILDVDRRKRGPEEALESGSKEEENDREPLPYEVIFEGSAKMAAVGQVVDKILDVDLPVLITGESGTGKEIVAKYIHGKSSRKGPFIKVNCAAIPSELLESELFGYERGAFTGAYRRKPGKFEAADGGVLFLDEISELFYPLQSKLLHVLQDGTVTTLGSTREVKVDVRIIVATNQDLEECVQRGSFRDDLFFRLNVVHINVPPLRERLRQLETLIDYFRDKFARQYNKTPVHLDDDAKNFLFNYRWPGNIRELENTIRRATVLGGANLRGHMNGLDQITTAQHPDQFPVPYNKADLPGAYPPGTLPPGTLPKDTYPKSTNPTNNPFPADAALDQSSPKISGNDENTVFPNGLNLKEIAKEAALAAEREAIARVLQQTRWNRKKTAQILSVSYKTLLTKIKETGLDEN